MWLLTKHVLLYIMTWSVHISLSLVAPIYFMTFAMTFNLPLAFYLYSHTQKIPIKFL